LQVRTPRRGPGGSKPSAAGARRERTSWSICGTCRRPRCSGLPGARSSSGGGRRARRCVRSSAAIGRWCGHRRSSSISNRCVSSNCLPTTARWRWWSVRRWPRRRRRSCRRARSRRSLPAPGGRRGAGRPSGLRRCRGARRARPLPPAHWWSGEGARGGGAGRPVVGLRVAEAQRLLAELPSPLISATASLPRSD